MIGFVTTKTEYFKTGAIAETVILPIFSFECVDS